MAILSLDANNFINQLSKWSKRRTTRVKLFRINASGELRVKHGVIIFWIHVPAYFFKTTFRIINILRVMNFWDVAPLFKQAACPIYVCK